MTVFSITPLDGVLGPLDLGLGHFMGSLELSCVNEEEILAD